MTAEKEKKCKFCEDYAFAQAYGEKAEKSVKDHGCDFVLKTFVKVSLVEESYRYGDGWKNRAGLWTFRQRPLNYCPTCGKKLKKRRRK